MALRWVNWENNILRQNYIHRSKPEILKELPDRNWCAIQHQAERLGLFRDPKYQYEGMIRNTHTNNPMNNPLSRQKSSQKQWIYGAKLTQGQNRLDFIKSRGYKCERCGASVKGRQFNIHHKDKNRHNNDPSNLELLCRSCHNLEHKISKNLGIFRSRTAKVVSIKEIGEVYTYDLHTPKYHNFILSNGIISHNSMKSGINVELGCVMDKHFSAEKICFTDQEFLDVVSKAPRQSFVMRDEVTSAGEFGIGSGRMQAFITIQTETLRQSQISIGMISPTEKQLGTAHYILHCIGHNKFRLDKDGYNLDPVYVLVGVMNPSTHHYLGSVIFEIDWMSKIWKEYQKKKLDFLKSVKEMDFAKQDYHLLAEKCRQHPNSTYAKTKYDWLVIIQEIVPSMTTDEMMMLYSTIKMEQRKGEF